MKITQWQGFGKAALIALFSLSLASNDASAQGKGKWEKLFNDLKDKDNTTREIITERETEEPIRFTWIFILIVLLMTAEWFIRKYNGAI